MNLSLYIKKFSTSLLQVVCGNKKGDFCSVMLEIEVLIGCGSGRGADLPSVVHTTRSLDADRGNLTP